MFNIFYNHERGRQQFGQLFESLEQAKVFGYQLPPASKGQLMIYDSNGQPVFDLAHDDKGQPVGV